jgi:hypothetical protein
LVAALEPDVRGSRLMAAAWVLLLWCALGLAFPAFAGERIALVVGAANYQHGPALAIPETADVAAALSAIGFTTTLRLDVDKRQLDQALEQFAREAKTADAAIFYYAGLGLQFKGRNFLTPVDAQLSDPARVGAELVAVDDVKTALNGSKGLKILILDASRENPFAGRLASSEGPLAQGLARDEASADMIIAYAAKAGQIARDAESRGSPFTAALLRALKQPGLEVGALFRQIASDVAAATGGAETPELVMSATPEYYLNPSQTDRTVWSSIRNGRDLTALEDFIARFPTSSLVPDAIARIEVIESRKRIQSDVAEAGDKNVPVGAAASAAPPQTATAAPEAPKPDLTPPIRDQLRRLGCFEGADADWSSPAMQSALAQYVRRSGRSVTSPDAALLETMKTLRNGLCRPVRAPKVVASRCSRKLHASGALSTSAGACVRASAARPRADERCFLFGKPVRCATLSTWLKPSRAPSWGAPFPTPSSSPPTGRGR